MAITVKDIVEIAQKKGCVLATGESKLSKEVCYVDTMEIPDMEALVTSQHHEELKLKSEELNKRNDMINTLKGKSSKWNQWI